MKSATKKSSAARYLAAALLVSLAVLSGGLYRASVSRYRAAAGDIERLALLQKHIDAQLSPLGFKPENRPFTPHLTIARIRDRASSEERRRFGLLIKETVFDIPLPVEVKSVHLMRSQLTREGPIYSSLVSASLGQ